MNRTQIRSWLQATLAALSLIIRDTNRSRQEREAASEAHYWLQKAASTCYNTGETQIEWILRRLSEGYRPGKSGRRYALVCDQCAIQAYYVGKEAHAMISYLVEQGFAPADE